MNTKICVVLAIVAFAQVCEINGASKFNLPETLRAVKNSWTDKGKPAVDPVVEIVEMNNIEKGSELAKQVDAAVEQARKDGTTGRFFKKFMTMGQNNQPTIIVVPIVMENTVTSSTSPTTTTTQTSNVDGFITLTPVANAYRNAGDSENDEEEEMITEEHEIDSDDDDDVEEGKATKKKNNKRGNNMRRKNKNKSQSMKKAFNKGVNVDIPPQYRKYFNNQKQVHIPASMLQKAKAQRAGNKNGNKRRMVRRKPNRRN
ncbi:hypothetical protein ACFFRR_009307 [Megaselia abdita]